MLLATRNSVHNHNQILSKIVYAPFSFMNVLFFSCTSKHVLVLYLFRTENDSGPHLYTLNRLIITCLSVACGVKISYANLD